MEITEVLELLVTRLRLGEELIPALEEIIEDIHTREELEVMMEREAYNEVMRRD